MSTKTQDDVIVSGSTWAAIWHMSWPLFLNMVNIAIASCADTWVAGRLGPDSQAAIGIGGQIWFFMVIMTIALATGTNALVSRFTGANEMENVIEAARQSILFSIFFGAAQAGLGILFARPLLAALGASPAVQELGWQYLSIDLLGQIPLTIVWVINSIFRARGNARVPMMINMLNTFLVILCDLGLCIYPFKIGIAGIGWAWAISSLACLIVAIFVLKVSDLSACLDLKALKSHGISKEWFGRLMKIGMPACVQDLAWVGGNFGLFLIFARTPDPTSFQAAWAVGLRIEEMVAGMPVFALNMAVATIVGQNLGAKQPERAERSGWQVTMIGAILNIFVALVLFFGGAQIAHIMSGDKTVALYSAQYLQIIGLAAPSIAVWIVLSGAMQGAGYTRWPMYCTVICLALLRLPLAWYLTINANVGPIGTWFALAFSCFVLSILFVSKFREGTWKLQSV